MIYIVGLGPGSIDDLSLGTHKLLFGDKKVFLRTKKHPIVEFLEKEGLIYESFDDYYEIGKSFEDVYSKIIKFLIEEDEYVYAVPGHPLVAEHSVTNLIKELKLRKIKYKVIGAMSFLDSIFSSLEVDPSEGFVLLDANTLNKAELVEHKHIILTQMYDEFIASEAKLKLQEFYEDEELVTLINAAGIEAQEKSATIAIKDIDRIEWDYNHLTSLLIRKNTKKKYKDIKDLEIIMKTLRGKNGCPWDKEQTRETLAPMFLDEVKEVVEAIKNCDLDNLVEELGDVLLHIIFQIQIGEEEGYFSLDDVTTGIVEKMIRRHPHVFGEMTVKSTEEVNLLWNEIKKQEKSLKK